MARAAEQKQRNEMIQAGQQKSMRSQNLGLLVRTERAIRREDWMLGPLLAPRRDVGTVAHKYGTADSSLVRAPNVYAKKGEEVPATWLAEGDRVVLLKGKDQGKIARITEVEEESRTVKVQGLNTVRIGFGLHLCIGG